MKLTSVNELREKFLQFFEQKAHLRLPSFSLVPQDDNSLLLINSGMAPMKKFFTGEITPPCKRVTTCQKCIRTPDIESVGITARHGTFFEMLGCFSFGDYFKHEIIKWSWEFCTKVLEMPKDRLWVSVYEKDDETIGIWHKETDIDLSHIVKLGKSDNFWEHGKGPCGPCSELYFDRGEQYSCGSQNCGVGCDCDRYIEFWNLVFTQFENDGSNNYSKLAHPNIDTGMGLERLACIVQNAENIFLVDSVQNIIKEICKITNTTYGQNAQTDISIRIIADHIRSATFMIADGIMPANDGRGYVLKRLLRRAARQGKLLHINEPFLSKIAQKVIEENKVAYPILLEKQSFVQKVILTEEENFLKTIDQGLSLLEEIMHKTVGRVISGDDAFKLNDTFGFPIDLTKEILAEKNMQVDENRFKELLEAQKIRARNARQNAGEDAWASSSSKLLNLPKTEFCGYKTLECSSKILAILKDGKIVRNAHSGDKIILILDKTPFYAESGGQIGDVGTLTNDSVEILVNNTQKNSSFVYFHHAEITLGEIKPNDKIIAKVNKNTRAATAKNHTAAHLLQAALRKVLGNHVEQAGQLVNEKEVRFDFTHFSSLNLDELTKIEELVNQVIQNSIPILVKEMPIAEAKKIGAMALFGEKYGDVVRVVNVDDFSIELCGGTHVENTAALGLFKIISENSVAAGVRRITAITSLNVLNYLEKYQNCVENVLKTLKISSINDVKNNCQQIMSDLKEKDKKIEELTAELAELKISELLKLCKTTNGTKIIVEKFRSTSADSLKAMCDKIKSKTSDFAAILAGTNEEKAIIVVALGKNTVAKNLHAGKIIKEVAQLAGGKGGGKANLATAGIKNVSKLDFALEKSVDIITKYL